MKEPGRAIHKDFCLKACYSINPDRLGSFITIPNSLKQFPAKKSDHT